MFAWPGVLALMLRVLRSAVIIDRAAVAEALSVPVYGVGVPSRLVLSDDTTEISGTTPGRYIAPDCGM
jgi:hypothetical protein